MLRQNFIRIGVVLQKIWQEHWTVFFSGTRCIFRPTGFGQL